VTKMRKIWKWQCSLVSVNCGSDTNSTHQILNLSACAGLQGDEEASWD